MVGDEYTQVLSGLSPGQSVVLADYAERALVEHQHQHRSAAVRVRLRNWGLGRRSGQASAAVPAASRGCSAAVPGGFGG